MFEWFLDGAIGICPFLSLLCWCFERKRDALVILSASLCHVSLLLQIFVSRDHPPCCIKMIYLNGNCDFSMAWHDSRAFFWVCVLVQSWTGKSFRSWSASNDHLWYFMKGFLGLGFCELCNFSKDKNIFFWSPRVILMRWFLCPCKGVVRRMRPLLWLYWLALLALA